MPYSYGKENLRQSSVSVQRREPSPIPARSTRREPVMPSPVPTQRARRELLAPVPPPVRTVRREHKPLGDKRLQMMLGIGLIVFSLAVILNRVLAANPVPALQFMSSAQIDQANWTAPIRVSFPVQRINKSVTAFRQGDKAQYNSAQQWSVWSNSACSGCAMAALLDAYGANINSKPLDCADVLTVEYRLGVYNPVNDWGLQRGAPDELAKTATQFGFTGHYSQNLSLDDLIVLGNAGVPSIVRIPTHIMVLTGGDSQNVFLADSGGLHLSRVTRDQFLHGLPGSRLYAGQSWMVGWYVILTPNN